MSLRNAVILAAGKGQRLDRPDTPKALVRIGHKPLLLWTIERLQEAGVRNVWIVAGPHAAAYRKELSGHPAVTAAVTYLETATGSGDMLESVLALPEEVVGPFVLTVVDVMSEANPYALLASLPEPAYGQLVSVVGTDPAMAERSGAHNRVRVADGVVRAVGRELVDGDGLEVGIAAVGSNGGAMFRALRAAHPGIRTFEDAVARLAADGRVRAAPLPGEWYDVNTPATAVRAEMLARRMHYGASPERAPSGAQQVPAIDASFSRTKTLHTDIVIRRGLLGELRSLAVIEPARRHSPHFLLTDSTVDALYGDAVLAGFRDAGMQMVKLVMPAGEHAKSIETYTELADRILSHGMDEGSVIVDVGGGVVNNMAGFLAATLYRGVGLIHIPTTTMAQVDAAIDFKQAVNSKKGKNLTGAYHPASHILIDPETIATLPERHVRNGLGETLKHAITQDAAFTRWLMDYRGDVRDTAFIEEMVRRTIALKVPLLNGDPHDEVNEMVPQYGHAVGHAVEHLSGYGLLHGEAVAIGMCVTAEVAKRIGVCDDATLEAHYALCAMYGLPTQVPVSMKPDDVLDTIRYDKHYLGGLPRMALVPAVGGIWKDQGTVAIPIDYPILGKAIAANQARTR